MHCKKCQIFFVLYHTVFLPGTKDQKFCERTKESCTFSIIRIQPINNNVILRPTYFFLR